jgi:hypothetical protein
MVIISGFEKLKVTPAKINDDCLVLLIVCNNRKA